MATVTPNFNWPVPTSTDLVKDGATAIEALGDSIDGSLVDLKGGTTGQVLSKTSGTDMDFTWVTTDDANAIQNSIVDAKGDLISATANDTPARLAVGANDTMLVGDSTAATGLAYKSAATLYPWTSWTPTYQNFTIGNATVTAKYQQVGKLTNVFCQIVWGSTTSFTAYPIVIFPAGLTSVRGAYITGTFEAGDVSAGTAFIGNIYIEGGLNKFQGTLTNASSTYAYGAFMTANTLPFTWTTGDVMTYTFTFEAA